jgi:hypothetical protein
LERLGIIFYLLTIWYTSHSQLSFDEGIFPVAGDTLTYQKDIINVPDNFEPGGNQSWDFTFLQSPLYGVKTFNATKFYKKQKDANTSFEVEDEQIALLFQNDGTAFNEIGFLLPLGKDQRPKFPVYYDTPIEQKANDLIFNTRSIQVANFTFVLERSQLPHSIVRDIPASIKKIMIKGKKTVIRHSDAWGYLFLPGETMWANRVRVIENMVIQILDNENGKIIPYFDEEMIIKLMHQRMRNRYYEFYSDNYQYMTAKVSVNDKNFLTTIDYQTKKLEKEAIDIRDNRSDFILYPNPTYNIAKVFINNKNRGNYALAVYNIIGKKLWQRSIDVDGSTIIKENFGFLSKGTYLISLLDENGNILRTTRLIIISV